MLENNPILIVGIFLALIALFLIFLRIAYVRVQPVRNSLPDEVKALRGSLDQLELQEKRLTERATVFLGLAQEPYGKAVESLRGGLSKLSQMRSRLEPDYLDIQRRFPGHRLSHFDSLWLRLAGESADLKSRIAGCQGLLAETEKNIQELERLPGREAEALLDLQAEFAILSRNFKQLIASAGMSGGEIDELIRLEKQIEAEFPKIPPALANLRGQGASIDETVLAHGIAGQIRSKNGVHEEKVKGLRARHKALIDVVEETGEDLKKLTELLKVLQAKPLALDESREKLRLLQVEASGLKQKVYPVNMDSIDEFIEKSRNLKQRSGAALQELGRWAEAQAKFEELYPQVSQKINRLKALQEAKPSQVTWNENLRSLTELRSAFNSIPGPQIKMSRDELEKCLAAAEASNIKVLQLETACLEIKKQAADLFDLLGGVAQFYEGQEFLNLQQLARESGNFDPQNWEAGLNVGAFPAELNTRLKTFKGLSIQAPLDDRAVAGALAQALEADRIVTELRTRAGKIKIGLEALKQQKNNCQQEINNLLNLLRGDLAPFLNSPGNPSGKNTNTLLVEIDRLNALYRALDEKSGRLAPKIEEITRWKAGFLNTFKRILQESQTAALREYSALKKTRQDSRDFLARLDDEAVLRANQIQAPEEPGTGGIGVLSGQTLSELIDAYKYQVLYQEQLAGTRDFIDRISREVKPPYDRLQNNLAMAARLRNELRAQQERRWPPCEIDVIGIEEKWEELQEQQNTLNTGQSPAQAFVLTCNFLSKSSELLVGDLNEKLNLDKRYASEISETERNISAKIQRLPQTANPDLYRNRLQEIKRKYNEQRSADRIGSARGAKKALDQLAQSTLQPGAERGYSARTSDAELRKYCEDGEDILEKLSEYVDETTNIYSYQKSSVKKYLAEIQREYAANRLPGEGFLRERFQNIKRASNKGLGVVIEYLEGEQISEAAVSLLEVAEKVRDNVR